MFASHYINKLRY